MNPKLLLILCICACAVACQTSLSSPLPPSCTPSARDTPVGDPGSTPQASSDLWLNTYSGNYAQQAQAIVPMSDKESIFVGWSEFQNTAERHQDTWVVRLDTQGTPLWSKLYGGSQDDSANAVLATPDGCFLVGGFSASQAASAWLFKINADGALLWTKTYGAGFTFNIKALALTPDGGYLVLGSTNHVSFPASDAWVAKLDAEGNVMWSRILGGEGGDTLVAVTPTADGYLLAGYTSSAGAGKADAWLVKLDEAGEVGWSKAFGGIENDTASAIVPSGDGGIVVAGSTDTFDAMLFKLDDQGTVVWARALKGNELNSLYGLARGMTGGYVAVGSSHMSGAPASPWVIAVTDEGTVLRSQSYEAIQDSAATSIQPTSDDGYITAGGAGTSSHSAWLMQIDPTGNLRNGCALGKTLEIQSVEVILVSNPFMPSTPSAPLPTAVPAKVVVRDLVTQAHRLCGP